VQLDAFEHEALLYRGEQGFIEAVLPRLREAFGRDAAILVATDSAKTARLKSVLAGDAARVDFVDMQDVGRNPGRIIPVWRAFLGEAITSGRPACGVGEPIWPGRSADELGECQRHECLLNEAFGDGPGWWLGCPYDVDALPPEVIGEALRSHPLVGEDGEQHTSAGHEPAAALPAEMLPPVPAAAATLSFLEPDLGTVRAFTARRAEEAGLERRRTADLVLAVHELATNSLRYGGGRGTIRAWTECHELVLEVADAGHVPDPLAGRARPSSVQLGGRGLWLVYQLCDLVQLRSSRAGTRVRLRMAAGVA
jgi:anti-sigma regulatory factor (Ser/Thr protein kinase)